MTINHNDNKDSHKTELKFDSKMLFEIVKHRLGLVLVGFIAILTLCLFVGLYSFPQTYTSVVSISIQSNSPPAGALALLGGSNVPKKYIGVIKSRRLAAEIDKVVNFRDLMGLPNTDKGQEDALERVIRDIKVDDNVSDGLMYITVNLSGPAKMASDSRGLRKRLPYATALAANLYADALHRYMKDTDTDKELSLLRSAEAQVKNARARYENEMEELRKFIRRHKLSTSYSSSSLGVNSTSSPLGTTGGSGTSAETIPLQSELQSTYLRRNTLQQQLSSLKSLIGKTEGLLNQTPDEIASMPPEDPVLTTSRRQFNEALIKLKTLQITYGDSKPEVIRAKEQLNIFESKLHEQTQAILQGKTSEHSKLAALKSEYEVVLQQLAIQEKNLYLSKNSTFEYSKLTTNVTIVLEVYKAKQISLANLQVQTVSAQNRMAIVDPAMAPRESKPGFGLIIAVSLLTVSFFILIGFIVEMQLKQLKSKEL